PVSPEPIKIGIKTTGTFDPPQAGGFVQLSGNINEQHCAPSVDREAQNLKGRKNTIVCPQVIIQNQHTSKTTENKSSQINHFVEDIQERKKIVSLSDTNLLCQGTLLWLQKEKEENKHLFRRGREWSFGGRE
ncbi:Protein of unknown function, partial [Gryllus bimaculatus]